LESAIITLQVKLESQRVQKEPKISLPAKFDGSRAQFQGFINQVPLQGNMLAAATVCRNFAVAKK
jgi:hypothetical protein